MNMTFPSLNKRLMRGLLGLDAPALNAPAVGSFPVVPNDGADLPYPVRGVTLGGGGTLRYVGIDGREHSTNALPAGTYAVMAVRILLAGTSATDITGWV